MTKGKKFLSDLKLYSDFMEWNETEGRYETWQEAAKSVFDTHRGFYANKLDVLAPYLDEAEKAYADQWFLASQRSLQFRGKNLYKHQLKIYNCTVIYGDKVSFLGNAFYLLLCGCGVGANLMIPFVKRLTKIQSRNNGTISYVIEDSIEGWAKAAHVLVSSYCVTPVKGYEKYKGYKIKFDYSEIREKGAPISGKFKAPGHEGIKQSFEKIEDLLDGYVEDTPKEFKSILVYDTFMHLSDAVLSGGVRRAACSIICSPDDLDLIYAKTGNWREVNKQRARSNNSVGLIRGKFSRDEFQKFLELNKGISDIGFVFMSHIYENMNPCFEIGFTGIVFDWNNTEIVNRVLESDETLMDEGLVRTALQCCNLNEINAGLVKSEKDFYYACEMAAITGTLQAGYTKFQHLEEILEDAILLTEKEALLGISITGWTNSPFLFNADILQKGAQVVKDTNAKIASILGINPAARTTTVKPSGNASVILGCASGIHPEHSKRYFRVMQLNKETDTAKWLEKNMEFLLEESVNSSTNADYVVFVPIVNPDGTLYKNELQGVKHLELIKLVKENWVDAGKRIENCIIPTTSHNVSNTVIIDNYEEITNYIYEHQNTFTAVSFIDQFGDKDYNQSPNTSVLDFDELYSRYGEGILFASGLIVDGLHAFQGNLWNACTAVLSKDVTLTGDRYQVFEKKDWVKRAKKFAKNYLKNDIEKMTYCLKDVHLYHKWKTINREFKDVDFTKILTRPSFKDINEYSAMACSGGSCEITYI